MDERSEIALARDLIRVLHGLSIERAKQALMRAQSLLLSTQRVDADSALLTVEVENDELFPED